MKACFILLAKDEKNDVCTSHAVSFILLPAPKQWDESGCRCRL